MGVIVLPNDVQGKIILTILGNNYESNITNGVANFILPYLDNGQYDYTIDYLGDEKYLSFTKTSQLIVNRTSPVPPVKKTILKLKNVKVKRSAKKLGLKASLKEGKTPLTGKKITFKFNGKKYKAKTNAKGIAKITIKSKVLKKLKVGKKVKYQASYGKLVVKKSAKVKK